MADHGVIHWLQTGIMGVAHFAPPPLLYWHARLMVLGWTIAIPSGVFIARFFKILPRQNWPRVVDRKFWWVGFIAGFILLQARGWCVDTYQAIWGPALQHPGNRRRRLIGWGVRRP